jgi:hypothetical protein
MRRKLTHLFAALLFGAAGPGCGNDRTGNNVPTSTDNPKSMPRYDAAGGRQTLVPGGGSPNGRK